MVLTSNAGGILQGSEDAQEPDAPSWRNAPGVQRRLCAPVLAHGYRVGATYPRHTGGYCIRLPSPAVWRRGPLTVRSTGQPRYAVLSLAREGRWQSMHGIRNQAEGPAECQKGCR